jgi:exosortase B
MIVSEITKPRSIGISDRFPIILISASILVAFLPTYVALAEGPWQTEQEGHGPLIILAAAWIAWQIAKTFDSSKIVPAPKSGWTVLLGGLVAMILARSQDVLFIEVLSIIPVIAGSVLIVGGWSALRSFAFPIAFLFFSAPPPGWMLDAFTVPLKVLVSDVVAQILYAQGYPVAQNGVIIMIGSYQLLVADACAGMNSIFALSAIGFFYIYVMKYPSLARNLFLLACIVPITIVANFLRVLALVLTAYYAGIDSIGGGFHEATGMALFVVAMILLWLVDTLYGVVASLVRKLRTSHQPSVSV